MTSEEETKTTSATENHVLIFVKIIVIVIEKRQIRVTKIKQHQTHRELWGTNRIYTLHLVLQESSLSATPRR